MSNTLAIAAVTATLRNLMAQGVTRDPELEDTVVTTLPLDKARRDTDTTNQLNVFLYHAIPNGAWRNWDLPQQVKAGETGFPPLALNLYYMLTAYGRDNDSGQPFSHHVLGRAMRVLHDHPLLGRNEIRTALVNNDLHNQVERIRFTWQPLSVDDLSKLWTGFQSQYRLSVAYEAAVVLIESARASKAPLPVLTRGEKDDGVIAQPDLIPSFPTIDGILTPRQPSIQKEENGVAQQPVVEMGDTITVVGHHFNSGQITARFKNPLLTNPIQIQAEPGRTYDRLRVAIQNGPQAPWIAGVFTVDLEVLTQREGTTEQVKRTTNEVSLSLAPTITTTLPMAITRVNGNATVNLRCSPAVRPEQRVALLFGDREVPAEAHPATTNDLTFTIRDVETGTYLIRLRVDGTDSILIDRAAARPMFKPHQVTIS
jgi:hypothetical protein